LTIKGDGVTAPSMINSIRIISVPNGHFLTPEQAAAVSRPSARQLEQEIVDAHADEIPQLEHTPEPVASPPDPRELISQATIPVIEEMICELRERGESEQFDDREVESMFKRAALRVPRKPSWEP
jgi:hypothetical protein